MKESFIVTTVKANWDEDICKMGTIGDEERGFRIEDIGYGMTFEKLSFGYDHLGFSRKIVDDMSGDVYQVRISGRNDDEIKPQLKAFLKICKYFSGIVNTDEFVKFIPNTAVLKTEGIQETKRESIFGCLAGRSGESLFS
jgi:hypothetical protein